jgi:hypothetical protein
METRVAISCRLMMPHKLKHYACGDFLPLLAHCFVIHKMLLIDFRLFHKCWCGDVTSFSVNPLAGISFVLKYELVQRDTARKSPEK